MAQNLSRQVPALMMTELARPYFYPIILVHLDWVGAPVFAHSNVGALSFSSQTWLGVGSFGSLTLPEESAGMASAPATIRLMGLGPELDGYLDDDIRARLVQIYFGVVTARGGAVLVADPILVFSGYMDALRDVTEAGNGVLQRGVILTVASGPSQRAAAAVYHTLEDQQRGYPTDTAGRHTQFAEANAGNFVW